MKLRSAQFVLLVLLVSSLSLSEVSSLRLADEFLGSSSTIGVGRAVTCTAARQAAYVVASAADEMQQTLLAAATLDLPWAMRAPAAQAAALEAVTGVPASDSKVPVGV